jgi:hypothetical protein
VASADLLPLPDAALDRRFRIVLDWTIALFFRPDITKVDLAVEQDQLHR